MKLRPPTRGDCGPGAAVWPHGTCRRLDVPTLPTVTAPTVEPPPLPAPSLPAPTLPAPTVPAPAPTVTTPPSLPAHPRRRCPRRRAHPAPAPTPVSQVTETVQSAANAADGDGRRGGRIDRRHCRRRGRIGERNRRAAHRRSGGGVPGGYFPADPASAAPMPVSRVPIVASSRAETHRARSGRSARAGSSSASSPTSAAGSRCPSCRSAPPVVAWARSRSTRRGVNLIRFNGRLGKRWLELRVRCSSHRRCGSDSPSLPGVRRARRRAAAEHLPRGRGGAAQAARFRSGQPRPVPPTARPCR